MAVPAAVEAEELRVRRGEREVLKGLTFSVRAGSVTGLLGPSGCGKSTLMRAIVGVQSNVSGELAVLGVPAGLAPLRRRVSYVTQAPSVYGDITVRENLQYFAAVRDCAGEEISLALHRVGLAALAGVLVRRLSGGEHARVSLASALLGEPELLVLDEPTVGLDPLLRRSLWDLFHELAAAGATLLVSSHVMDEAARCEEILLLREGRLLAQTSPAALLARTGSQDLDEAFLRLVSAADGE